VVAVFVIKQRIIPHGRVNGAGGKVGKCENTFGGVTVAQVSVGSVTRW
jgi:hypothetical protein